MINELGEACINFVYDCVLTPHVLRESSFDGRHNLN